MKRGISKLGTGLLVGMLHALPLAAEQNPAAEGFNAGESDPKAIKNGGPDFSPKFDEKYSIF